MIYIVAGNYSEACNWAIYEGLERKEWSYVTSAEKLRGRQGPLDVRYVGRYVNHRDLGRIIEIVHYINARDSERQ